MQTNDNNEHENAVFQTHQPYFQAQWPPHAAGCLSAQGRYRTLLSSQRVSDSIHLDDRGYCVGRPYHAPDFLPAHHFYQSHTYWSAYLSVKCMLGTEDTKIKMRFKKKKSDRDSPIKHAWMFYENELSWEKRPKGSLRRKKPHLETGDRFGVFANLWVTSLAPNNLVFKN